MPAGTYGELGSRQAASPYPPRHWQISGTYFFASTLRQYAKISSIDVIRSRMDTPATGGAAEGAGAG